MPPPPLTGIVERALEHAGPVVLAVSGGLDSMALLHLVAACGAAQQVMGVATFDHGTGSAATRSVALVQREARRLGLTVDVGHGTSPATEAAWRAARWTFLRDVAARRGARVATAHTLDDQIETVCMRILRGSGARGLAGLLAEGDVVRPLLDVSRSALADWVRGRGIPFVDDPSNRSRAHLRNRVRLDLLPAIDKVRPAFRDELRAVGRSAARWREEVEAVAAAFSISASREELTVSRAALEPFDREGLGVLWPALAGRAGIVLDRRGTDRLTAFTTPGARTGARIQLAGGIEVLARRTAWLVRKTPESHESATPLADGTQLGGWRFVQEPTPRGDLGDDDTRADLPADLPLVVRPWQAGDRMRRDAGSGPRRVKRFFGDAGIAGPERVGWPVVLAGDEIVWIPGVSRSDAATVRSGRPAVRYVCERTKG